MKKAFALEVFAVSLILLMTLLYSYVQEDIWFWDEAFYLARGIEPITFGLPTWADSPGHSGLYALTSQFTGDPISTYLVGRAVCAAAFVGCVWIAGRLLLKPAYALTAAAIVSIVPITYGWPGVANISSGLIIISMVVLLKRTSGITFPLVTILLWIAATSRPELTYVALAASLFAIGWLFWDFRKGQAPIFWLASTLTLVGAIVMPLFLVIRYGNIFGRFEREWTAFSQHYGLRNSTSGKDVWISGTDAVNRDFPNSNSVIQALVEDPEQMGAHILNNLLLLPRSFMGNTLGFNAEQLTIITLPKIGLLGFFLLVFGLFLRNWRTCNSELRSWVRHVLRPIQRMASLLAVLVFAMSSISVLVIYPRAHYQLVAVGLLTIAVLMLLQLIPLQSWVSPLPLLLVAVAFASISIQSLFHLPERIEMPAKVESSLREINRSLALIRILSRDEPITLFLNGSKKVELPQGITSFSNAVRNSGTNVIYRSTILDESEWGLLDGYAAFFDNPEKFGFSPAIPESSFFVFKD